MGIYSEYLNKQLNFPQLTKERKKHLKRISNIRDNRAIFVFAAAITKKGPISIDYDDLLPISDQLSNLEGAKIDIILETPGGFAEIAEDIVKLIRSRFTEVAMIIPGHAKSAGTIMAMAGDEILMEPASALGPIDAQIFQGNRRFSAHAFLEGLKKIKEEVDEVGALNRAYIPILQNISPGDIQTCENLLAFSESLVTEWLKNYKFKFWKKHASSGNAVTEEEKEQRAKEIAEKLCNHGEWLTHGRSIKIEDLEGMRLKVQDYRQATELYDAISRYYTLLKMTFDSTNIFKLYETIESQIYRFPTPQAPPLPVGQKAPSRAIVNFECPNCKNITNIQASLKKGIPIEKGAVPFPKDDNFICPNCKGNINLGSLRRQIEMQTKTKVL